MRCVVMTCTLDRRCTGTIGHGPEGFAPCRIGAAQRMGDYISSGQDCTGKASGPVWSRKPEKLWPLAQDSGRPAGAGGRRLVCLPSRLRLLAKPSSPSAGATGF